MDVYFSDFSKQVLRNSRDIAVQFGFDSISLWHLLLSICDSKGAVINDFIQHNSELIPYLKSQILPTGILIGSIDMPLTRESNNSLKRAIFECKKCGAKTIEPEHLLLGILHYTLENIQYRKLAEFITYDKFYLYYNNKLPNNIVLKINQDNKINIETYCNSNFYATLNDNEKNLLFKCQIMVSNYWNTVLKELEELINYPRLKEYDLQQYLQKYPDLLLGTEYSQVIPHAVVKYNERNWETDFLLVPKSQYDFHKILELKLPLANTLRKSINGHSRFSSELYNAIGQLKDYRLAFQNTNFQEKFSKVFNTKHYSADLHLIIGRDEGLQHSDLFKEIQLREGLKVESWDSFIHRLKHTFV